MSTMITENQKSKKQNGKWTGNGEEDVGFRFRMFLPLSNRE